MMDIVSSTQSGDVVQEARPTTAKDMMNTTLRMNDNDEQANRTFSLKDKDDVTSLENA